MLNKNNLIIVGMAALIVVVAAILLVKLGSNTKSSVYSNSQVAQDQMNMDSPSSQVQGDESSSSAQTATDSGQNSNVKEFTVTGFNYGFSPNTLTVNKGDTVKITFKNSGGFHDFVINEFNVKTKTIRGGDSDTVTFVADKAGTFQFYCSVANHRQIGMVGTLTVQ